MPLSSVVTAANRHDMKAAFPTIDGISLIDPKEWSRTYAWTRDTIFQK